MRSTGLLRSASLLLLATSATLGACNAITGADGLIINEDLGAGGGAGSAGSDQTTGTGATMMTTTTTTTTTGGGSVFTDATGLSITQVALYQGVKATLFENGAQTNNAVPIVAGRDALLRVWIASDANYDGKDVFARVQIDGGEPIQVIGVPPMNSGTDNNLGSTLNFEIPGDKIPAGFSFRVELVQATLGAGPDNPAAHFPASGSYPTNAQSVGQTLKVTLVPVRYGADGSNRLPDLSESQIQGYKDLFYGMYPVPSVEITVRDPMQYNSDVSPNGYGWDQLLSEIGQLRAQDGAPFDVYYYGIFNPSSSVNSYCGGGCVAGLGNIGGPGDAYSRAAIGLGFSGDIAWETAVHEIGHTHGRYHAPCGGAQGTEYPNDGAHSGGKIATWGYNLVTHQLYNPSNVTDVMGYCYPIWVSDFTFKGFFDRIKAVNNASFYVPDELKNRTYDRARIDMDGNVHWLSPVTLELPPQAEDMELTVDTDDGTFTVTGQYYPYDHLPGGVILWPQAGAPSSGVEFEWKGVLKNLWK